MTHKNINKVIKELKLLPTDLWSIILLVLDGKYGEALHRLEERVVLEEEDEKKNMVAFMALLVLSLAGNSETALVLIKVLGKSSSDEIKKLCQKAVNILSS